MFVPRNDHEILNGKEGPAGKDPVCSHLGDFFPIQFGFLGIFSGIVWFDSITFSICRPFSQDVSTGISCA
jgi:hypothetical protein